MDIIHHDGCSTGRTLAICLLCSDKINNFQKLREYLRVAQMMREIYHLIRGSRMTRGSIFVLCAAPHAAMPPPPPRRSAIARAFHGLARPLWKWLTLTKRNCRITAPFFASSSSLFNFTLLSALLLSHSGVQKYLMKHFFIIIKDKICLETYCILQLSCALKAVAMIRHTA